MKAKPCMRNLMVEPAATQMSEKEDEGFAGFDIPEEYYDTRHKAERFDLFTVLDIGPDVEEGRFEIGDLVLIETAMLDIVDTPHGTVRFVPFNYVPIVFR